MTPDGSGAGAASAAAGDPVIDEILAGLARPQKTLPAKLFYDAEGCRLFGLITELDEYYLTRSEFALLETVSSEIAARAEDGSALVEYGASDEAKAETLLAHDRFSAYVPIDVAADALESLASRLAARRPSLAVAPVAADFTRPFALPELVRDRSLFGFFPGSTIGNFEPAAAVTFLAETRRSLMGTGSRARLVIGADLRKDPAVILPAYDDARGVTAAFNRNMLVHVNRLAGADFDPDSFRHVAAWNDAESRIEMHLASLRAQAIRVAGREISFEAGETIHTENSYKHTREALAALAARAGWAEQGFWTDGLQSFGIGLFEARA